MIKTYVKDNGSYKFVKKISVKHDNIWRSVKKAWVKKDGSWKQVFAKDLNIMYFHGAAGCYSGQAGFSLDYYGGVVTLTMGVWPTDPPNCQTCDSAWLQLGGTIANGNVSRAASNTRPYWTMVWTVNIDTIAIGASVQTRAPSSPYTGVPYTYVITRTGEAAITIERYQTTSTGDTGQSISISNWGVSFDGLAGDHVANGWTIKIIPHPLGTNSGSGGGGTGGTDGGDGGSPGDGTSDNGSSDNGSSDGASDGASDGGSSDGGAGDGGSGDGGGDGGE